MRIWDTHVHYPFVREPADDVEEKLATLFEEFQKVGIERAAILSGGRMGPDYEECLKSLEPYKSVAVPVAFLVLDKSSPEQIAELQEMGYKGLKILGPLKPYDHEDYWPIYAKAEELGLPIVFHLGVLGGMTDLLITDPHHDPESAERIRMGYRFRRRMSGRSALRMSPFHLDTLSALFPDLKMIGAHLGGTGYYDQSASVARWRPNVHFDISGGLVIQRHAEERGLIGKEISPWKLTFGSDCQAHEIAPYIDNWKRIFAEAGLTEIECQRIWWHNAAEVFGDEPVVWADEVGEPGKPGKID